MDLSKKKLLYVSGCSHLAGSEIIKFGDTTRTQEAVSLVWPGLLAKEFNLNYTNESIAGGSNEYILRSTIHFVSKWLEQGRDPKELMVVIGWTTNERLEFTHAWKEGQKPQHFHWATGSDWSMHYRDGEGPNFQNWFKALQLYHTDFDFGAIKRIINIILLDSYLKSVGVEYIQTSSCAKMDQAQWDFLQIKHLQEQFPFDTFFEPYDSFVDQYRDTHKEHFSDWLHADKLIHEMYFNKIKNFIVSEHE